VSLPTEQHVEKWLMQLGESDEAMAQATAAYSAAKENIKVQKAIATPSTGTSIERERAALTSAQYKLALDALKEAEFQKTLLSLKRRQWELGIDVWRSLNANMRH
jgi:hypothetical protein